MPCIPIPRPTLPPLPTGISLTPPPIPAPGFTGNVCCRIVSISTDAIAGYLSDQIPPIPPIAVNPAVIKALQSVFAKVATFLDSIEPECPRN